MNGYKTYAAAAAMALFGVYEVATGDPASGAMKIIGALGMVGIGHKLDKNTAAAVAASVSQTEKQG